MEATVATVAGQVRGQVRDGVTSFLGVPYAASPTGARRFRAPEPAEPWTGVRDASVFGPTPPKPAYAGPYGTVLAEPDIPGEEWLTVNVWTPAPGQARLPVLAWIHGGAFSQGNSAVPLYDGRKFASNGVVLVSMNYRLGVDGFALLPDAPANRGLLDQIAALEWVRDNISAFGGDPANVTVFGESSGAMCVTTLLAMPQARGLFARAICQSGAGQSAADPADANLVTGALGRVLGLEATARNLAEVDLPALIAAHITVRDELRAHPDPARFGATIAAGSMPFIPVVDGDLLPARPVSAIAAGAGAGLPLLTGTTTEEYRRMLVPSGQAGRVTEESLAGTLASMGIAAEAAGLYRASRPGASPGDLLCAVLTDWFFRLPALAVAQARAAGPAPTYLYEFAWPSPVGQLGACHGLELPFVFGNLAGTEPLTGAEAPRALAEEMHAAWIRFARSGDPGWRPFDDSYPVMVFGSAGGGTVNSGLVLDPRGAERRFWSG